MALLLYFQNIPLFLQMVYNKIKMEEVKMEYRKVKFYVLNGLNSDDSLKSKEEIKEFINGIYSTGESTDDGFKYKILEVDKKKYTFEFIELDDNGAFLRIRQPRPKNHYGKSDDQNPTLKELDIDINEHMESYTFLYINFSTFIVSHLKIAGTPSINLFVKFLMDQNGYGNGVRYSCDSIATDDIIRQIVNNRKFGTLSYSYVNPSDKALSNIPGITDTIKKNMRAKRSTIDVKITPEKNKNSLLNGKVLIDIKKWLLDTYGIGLKKFMINAGEFEDSKMVPFNLLNQEFTQETSIKADDELDTNEYMAAIKRAYNDIEATLKQYVKDI